MYNDMPHATQWADEFEEGIKEYGFSPEQIQRYKDFDYATIKRIKEEIDIKIRENSRVGRRTLLLCFYAGHAYTLDTRNKVLLNSNDRNKFNRFPLEINLRATAILEKGVYVIGLFACDRFKMPEE